MPRIDSHQHFWQLSRFPYPWMPPAPSKLREDFLPEHLGPVLARNRFQGCVCVQATTHPGEAEWLLALAREHAFILGVAGWVDLTSPEVGPVLDELQRDRRFVGVRHPVHDESDDDWLMRADVIAGLRELERRNLPFDLLLRPRHLSLVERLADRVPELRLVIDHLAKPLIADRIIDAWAGDIERIARIPQVSVKISGLITEADPRHWKSSDLAPYVRHTYNCFGPERCMFGSDWPVCLLAGTWKEVLAAFTQAIGPLTMAEREWLLGGTAMRFYGLDAPPEVNETADVS